MTSSSPGEPAAYHGKESRSEGVRDFRHRLGHWSYTVACLVLLVPLGLSAYVGWFSRYLADDFCTLGSLRDLGFLGSQAYWYMNWSGRYAFTFFVNLFETLGAWVVPVLPGVTLMALSAGLALAFYVWLNGRGMSSAWWISGLMGLLVVFETVAGAPNLYQSLYWQTGSLTYLAPLVLAVFYAAWTLARIQNGARGMGVYLLSSVWIFVAVGFSETIGALTLSALAGVWILLRWLARKSDGQQAGVRLLAAGLAGGVLGMLLMALAPGNAVRQGLLTPSGGLVVLASETVRDAYLFSVKALRASPVRLMLTAIVPLLAVFIEARRSGRADRAGEHRLRQIGLLMALPLLVFGWVMACMAPAQYAMSSYPDGRTLIGAQFAVCAGMAAWGAAAGWIISGTRSLGQPSWASTASLGFWAAALMLLTVTAFQAAGSIGSQLPDARDFARRWDERNTTILDMHLPSDDPVAVASLTHMGGLDEISRDANDWVNRCFAQTYGLRHVVAK